MKGLKGSVEEIVRQAAKLMTDASFQITEKHGAADIVTSSDIAVQHFLCRELKALLPESGFLCEEEHLQSEGDFIWIIDPIDGTANYSRGIAECAISVALVHEGRVVLGVVYNPYREQMFSAERGKGAFLNGTPIRVSKRSFEQSLFCTAASLYRKELAPICFRIIEDTYEKCNDIRRFGSCALEICYLAAGLCELYFEIRVFPWDYAAAYLILEEAGGVLRTLHGESPSLNRATPLIGANNEENYEMLNRIVDRYMKTIPYER